ncbi:MAG: prolipoprotein diacylglyceryl transferase [Clostridia bacterium]|nr:prolipoprotein diacylglyceryl transferase [Clostridia bacterium]
MYPYDLLPDSSIDIYLYGICMAVGIICCFIFLLWTASYKNFNEKSTDIILLMGVVATAIGILFAMLFQSVYNYIDTGNWSFGSMTFIGGLIGGVGSYLIFYFAYTRLVAPHAKAKWLKNDMNATLADAVPFIPIGITIAHAFGRLGCFFAGCCYGVETDAWYGIKFETTSTTVVPTQLFECIFLVLLTVVMALLYFKFHFNCNFGVYCIAYGVWRFVLEFWRGDNRGTFIGSLSPSQFWCIVMVLLGIAYFFAYKYIFKKYMKHPENQPPVNPKKAKKANSTPDAE